jgi:acyl-CoA synthetase (AMP-forming)/AMP-acid ligase II
LHASGYYNRPDVTAEAFHVGWFLTGDLGYMAEGEVFITGRKKDLIIVGGKNVYSRDLENIVNEVAGVHPGRTAAFGVPNVQSGTEDVAIVAETDEESPERREEIAEAVREAIAKNSDVVARYVRIVERGWLVKNSSGKVSRSANREKFLAELQGE